MSWMDSWSRPRKDQPIPPPLYLTAGGEDTLYCKSCGRMISDRKTKITSSTSKDQVRYCSDRCRHKRPGPLDRRIEATFISLLNGQTPDLEGSDTEHAALPPPPPRKEKKVKGDPRIIVYCEDVEKLIFGVKNDPTKVYGRKRNRATRALDGQPNPDGEWRSVDMEDPPATATATATGDDHTDGTASATASDVDAQDTTASEDGGVAIEYGFGAGKVRPPQTETELNFSAMGGERGWAEKIEETPEMERKRLEGVRRAEEKEIVKRAARRLCAFGVGGEKIASQGKEVSVEEESLDEEDGRKKRKGKKSGKGAGAEKDGKDDKKGKAEGRKCEAVMNGNAIEASFAKGEWGIRWRE